MLVYFVCLMYSIECGSSNPVICIQPSTRTSFPMFVKRSTIISYNKMKMAVFLSLLGMYIGFVGEQYIIV